jgi:hypothetical protein
VACLRADPSLERLVCVCPDGGANYESTLYDDAWLVEHGYHPGAAVPVAFSLPELDVVPAPRAGEPA